MGIGVFLHVLVFSTPQILGTGPGSEGCWERWEACPLGNILHFQTYHFPMGCDIVMKGNMGRSEKDLSLALVSLISENARTLPLSRQLQGIRVQNVVTQSPSSGSLTFVLICGPPDLFPFWPEALWHLLLLTFPCRAWLFCVLGHPRALL